MLTNLGKVSFLKSLMGRTISCFIVAAKFGRHASSNLSKSAFICENSECHSCKKCDC